MFSKIKSYFKVMHYFINKYNNCHFDSQMQQFNRRCGLPTLACLAAASRRFTVKYKTFASVNQTNIIFVRKTMHCGGSECRLPLQLLSLQTSRTSNHTAFHIYIIQFTIYIDLNQIYIQF